MKNKLGRSQTRSENVHFAKNEQTSNAVFTSVFYFTHAEHNLIKLKLHIIDQCKLLTIFRSVL